MATNQEMHSQTYVSVAKNLNAPVSEIPAEVWGVEVKRGGQLVSALQELADTKTLALKNAASLAALTELVSQLAAGGDVDYTRIEAASKAGAESAIREGIVTVTINAKEAP